MIAVEAPKAYVRTLSLGWRFTLPAHIRKEQGFKTGSLLRLYPKGSVLVIEGTRTLGEKEGHLSDFSAASHLGSGGKLVIPSEIRGILGWEIGERLSITQDNRRVIVTTCCPRHRCRSCGSLTDVKEVIPNLFLCAGCLETYASKLKVKNPRSSS